MNAEEEDEETGMDPYGFTSFGPIA